MPSTTLSCARAIVLCTLLLSGCFSFGERGDGFESDVDCDLKLRTSGAVEGTIERVDGCSDGRMIFANEDGHVEGEISVGAHPRDSRPFHDVVLTFYELLEEAGEGIAVDVWLVIDDSRQWRTPQGACTADYESEPCSDDFVEDGLRYRITGVECSDPAESESDDPVTIEALTLTSSCTEPLRVPLARRQAAAQTPYRQK